MKEDKKRSTDGAVVAALARWPTSSSDDGGQSLQEFVDRYRLPQLVRIVKGQYPNLGASNSCVLLCSRVKRPKVAAQCVKFKEDGRKVVPVGPRLAIPDNYDGWFEILSEEGRSMRCGNGNVIESVAELARRFPDSCLVREPIKAYVARSRDFTLDDGGGGGGGGTGVVDDGLETITDKVRTIAAGETLVLVSEVVGTSAAAADKSRDKTTTTTTSAADKSSAGRFLRCFDGRGENVYLSFEQRGKFSAVAKQDNISGVHSIENLMSSKRLPMMVRLVSGKWPASGNVNGKTNFVPELRLFATFEEQCVMAMPLQSKASASASALDAVVDHVVAVPLTARVKVGAAKNADVLDKTPEFARLVLKCRSLLTAGSDVAADDDDRRIHVIAGNGHAAASAAVASAAMVTTPAVCKIGKSKKPSYFRRAFSDPSTTRTPCVGPQPQPQPPLTAPCDGDEKRSYDSTRDDSRYDEIDQIYDYVRGFAPMPMPKKVAATDGDESSPSPATSESATKPDPPPIETIPARRYADLPATTTATVVAASSTSSSMKRATDNLYERIPRKTLVDAKNSINNNSNNVARYYVVHSRSSSSSSSKNNKLYVKGSVNGSQNGAHGGNNRLMNMMNNHRSSCGSGNARQRCRFFRPLMMAAATTATNKSFGLDKTTAMDNGRRSGKSSSSMSSASPIFDIRYKSLTNLAVESSKPSGNAAGSYIYDDNDDDDDDEDVKKGGGDDFKVKSKDRDRVVVAKNRLKKTMALMVVAAAAGPRLARPKSLSSLVVVNRNVGPVNRTDVSNGSCNDGYCSKDVVGGGGGGGGDDDDDVSTTASSVVLLRRKVDDDVDEDAKRIGTLYL